MELQGSEFFISHTFLRKRYISIERNNVAISFLFAETIPFGIYFL